MNLGRDLLSPPTHYFKLVTICAIIVSRRSNLALTYSDSFTTLGGMDVSSWFTCESNCELPEIYRVINPLCVVVLVLFREADSFPDFFPRLLKTSMSSSMLLSLIVPVFFSSSCIFLIFARFDIKLNGRFFFPLGESESEAIPDSSLALIAFINIFTAGGFSTVLLRLNES